MKKTLGKLSFVILLVGLAVSLFLSQQRQEIRKEASGEGVDLSMNPANISTTSQETFSVAVIADTHDNAMTAVELHINYDQAKLEAVSITVGSFLPVVLTGGLAGAGTASITLGSQPTEPKKGSGILVTLTFKALTPSTSQINLDESTQIAVLGKTTNAVETMTGSQVTVGGATTISVSPCSQKVKGDANCDDSIDGIDYSIWLRMQCRPSGSIRCAESRADFNNDENINDDDYKIWFAGRE